MEPIGLTVGVIGLAGVFSVCLDVIEKVDSYKDYGVESRSIVALFEGYKYLFKKWAQDVGINNPESNNNHYNQLDNAETKLRVHREAFLDWISPDFSSGMAKFLWIHGPAGHGKTILCARVVQYLSSILESPLAYYFCSSDSETRRDPSNIVRSWVSQVISCNRDAFELACVKWEAKGGRNASQTDIIDLFKTIIQCIPNCTFVVDGLDECAWAKEKWKSNYDDSPLGFFESVKEAVANTTTRILILSRDEPEIRYGFRTVLANDSSQGLNEYKIRTDDVRPDAMLFSRSIVNKKLANKSETLKHELSQRIAGRCKGMFLWVKMLEEELRSGKNKKQLQETIDQAPTALDHLYDRNWEKVLHLPEKDRARALSILRWATFALRPLTILEITEALLIVDNDSEDLSVDEWPDTIDEDYVNSEILGLCGSLIETQKAVAKQDLGLMTIHLAHFSVRQYILCNMPAQGRLLMVNERLHASSEAFQSNELAKLCLCYLKFRSLERKLGVMEKVV
ncbi:ankyrin-1 [Tricladium varicosporioides]|nr:ankyrin-1 [Hymenoscyphus varicosporioides]